MRPIVLAPLLAIALSACGGGDRPTPTSTSTATSTASSAPGRTLIALLGDSITAGSPRWDPDPAVRARIGPALDERSRFEHWAARRLGQGVAFRNCGVFGERTDEIGSRLDPCAAGARVLIVQGGINDIAQGRPVAEAAAGLRAMVRAGKARGLRVLLADVLPWNNGHPAAAAPIRDLNRRIRALGRAEGVRVLSFFAALEDPQAPDRMRAALTDDGDHPSVAGYERLGALVPAP